MCECVCLHTSEKGGSCDASLCQGLQREGETWGAGIQEEKAEREEGQTERGSADKTKKVNK